MFEELGRALDNLIHRVSSGTTTVIDARTDAVSIDYPEGDLAKLRLELAVGKLKVVPGGEKLVEGTATYNVAEWAPKTIVEGSSVTLKQGEGWAIPPFWGEMKNEWDLRLGTARPLALNVAKGVANIDLALGGLPLANAVIEAGTGKLNVSFDQPNPQTADKVELKGGVGEMVASGLLNTGAQTINVNGGMGEVRLGFTGQGLSHDMTANVGLGVGEAKIEVKAGVPVRVTLSQGLGSTRVSGDLHAVAEHVYETPGYALASGPKLTMKVSTGVGGVSITTV